MRNDGLFPKLSRKRKQDFSKPARMISKSLLMLLNLTGGGPTRGIELEVLPFVNTSTQLRSFLFAGQELMILSAHTKKRSEMISITRMVSRRPDKETSFLSKAYLLLVLPILQEIVVSEEFSSFNVKDSAESSISSLEERQKRI